MASDTHRLLRRVLIASALASGLAAQAGAPTAAPSPQTPTRTVQQGLPRAQAEAAAARIDRLLAAGLQRAGETPTERIDDATFVRRAYLTAIGRIPTADEAQTFLDDAAQDKRAALVDRLLDSPGYTSNTANGWFDLLRIKSRQRQLSGEPFAHWIREAVRAGKPYDEFVRELLTATGAAHAEGNGATGYLLRDANMPHDAMANTLRVFLGTRVECAQCHNHPFDKWSQRDFYAMAAFFGGLRYRVDVDRERSQQLRQALGQADDRQKQIARRLLQSLATGIAGAGTGAERLPKDYKYDDAKPGDLVHAATIFGAEARLPKPRSSATAPRERERQRRGADRPAATPEVDSRRAFADWLTDARNPRFARVAVNRTWQRLFGRGLTEAFEDLKDDTVAVHPELEKYLEKLLVELHFDLRQFERVLLLTQLFQREALPTDPVAGEPYHFRAPLLRRLSAEQLWDSLLTLVFDDIDRRLRPTDARAREVYARQAKLADATQEELAAMLAEPQRLVDPQRVREQAQKRMAAAQQTRTPEEQQRLRTLQRELAVARRRGDAVAIDRLQGMLADLGVPRPGERSARGRDDELQRASDLPQPTPANHLLRQFGQSDRETVDAATRAATVPQALTLLNGPFAAGETTARRRMSQATSLDAKVRIAFLAILTRSPSAGELATWTAALQADLAQGSQDLIWVLCNCNEFRFCR